MANFRQSNFKLKYFQGSYYLIKLKPAPFGSMYGREIMTASRCFNEIYMDSWSFSWSDDGKNKNHISQNYHLEINQIDALQSWVDDKMTNDRIGWSNAFFSIDDLDTYKSKFFSGRNDLLKIGLSFSEIEANDILEYFNPLNDNTYEIGLTHCLRRKNEENMVGKFIGYDIVAVDCGGSMCSFHCHNLQLLFEEQFHVKINKYGLIEGEPNWDQLVEFCNDESHCFGSLPWYCAKVRLYE